jgi:fructose 1,6-bisphosphate aldolase/phosphatase
MAKVTLSVIKADVGGYVGHSGMHPALMDKAEKMLSKAAGKGLLNDFRVMHCGDDLELIMTHKKGAENKSIHKLAWDVFLACTDVAKKLKLYGAGQDILKDAFSGTVKGMGPGVAEMEIEERKSEPVIVFMADKTSPGAWNLPLYRIFADPFNTAGLVIDPAMHGGFSFEILDIKEHKRLTLSCPQEMYDLLMFIGAIGRFLIKSVYRSNDKMLASTSSTQVLSQVAGRYVGKDDPVTIVRCQSGLPAVGEVLEPFAFPHMVEGWMRGSHHGPLMPVSFNEANPSRFDGPPRVIAAGFQLTGGKLTGPRDMFDDPSFDESRRRANDIANYIRAHGPFEPHRLGLETMEYTTMPKLMEKFEKRFKKEKD